MHWNENVRLLKLYDSLMALSSHPLNSLVYVVGNVEKKFERELGIAEHSIIWYVGTI